jgi:hypothetical protein
MRVIARQFWWLQVVRISIGCATICAALQSALYSTVTALRHHQTRLLYLLLPAAVLLALAGILFAIYSRLEWRPRGVAVAMTRHGLILKANGFRWPKLVVIKWTDIRGAEYIAATLFPYRRASVSVFLIKPMPGGTLPTERGGVIALTPDTIGLTGFWEQWHPKDVARLICSAANDPAVRAAL